MSVADFSRNIVVKKKPKLREILIGDFVSFVRDKKEGLLLICLVFALAFPGIVCCYILNIKSIALSLTYIICSIPCSFFFLLAVSFPIVAILDFVEMLRKYVRSVINRLGKKDVRDFPDRFPPRAGPFTLR